MQNVYTVSRIVYAVSVITKRINGNYVHFIIHTHTSSMQHANCMDSLNGSWPHNALNPINIMGNTRVDAWRIFKAAKFSK